MITVIQGRPGQGKTVYLVALIGNFLRRGKHVYTNINLNVSNRYASQYHIIEDLSECTNVRSGEIVLDEIQVYLNSRNWDKLDPRFQVFLQQHRKRGLNITGACQSIKRADVVFRELVQRFYQINKILTIGGPYPFGFFYLREYDPDSIESISRNYEPIGWPWLFFADPFTMKQYNTYQELELKIPVGRIITETYVLQEKKEIKPIFIKKTIEDPK
jgi:hypothetical protein